MLQNTIGRRLEHASGPNQETTEDNYTFERETAGFRSHDADPFQVIAKINSKTQDNASSAEQDKTSSQNNNDKKYMRNATY